MTGQSELERVRDTRNALRDSFNRNLDQVRSDLNARGPAARIADRVSETVSDALDETLDVLDANRGVVAGTVAALALWLLRRPIISAAERLLGRHATDE